MKVLKTVTFAYDARQDRILVAVNAGKAEPWSGWLTRRVALAVLERTEKALSANSTLVAQRVPVGMKQEMAAFQRDADLAKTARSVRPTPRDTIKAASTGGELVSEVSMKVVAGRYRLELKGESGDGAGAAIGRPDLQRIVDLLRTEIDRARWLAAPVPPKPAAQTAVPPVSRH